MREDGRVGERWEGWRKGGSGGENRKQAARRGGGGRQAGVSPTRQGREERNQPERRRGKDRCCLLPCFPPAFLAPLLLPTDYIYFT